VNLKTNCYISVRHAFVTFYLQKRHVVIFVNKKNKEVVLYGNLTICF